LIEINVLSPRRQHNEQGRQARELQTTLSSGQYPMLAVHMRMAGSG